LAAGSYSLSLVATTPSGNSTPVVIPSFTVASTPKVVAPSAPVVSVTSNAKGTVVVTLKKAVSAGTGKITGYQYSLNGKKWTNIAPQKNGSFVIHNLTSGKKYNVQLRAVSASVIGSANKPITVKVH